MLRRFIAIYISFIPLFSFGQTTKLIEELKSHKLPIFEIILNTQDQITSCPSSNQCRLLIVESFVV